MRFLTQLPYSKQNINSLNYYQNIRNCIYFFIPNPKNTMSAFNTIFLEWIQFQNITLCVVDWGELSQKDYKSATMNVFDVGFTVAALIQSLEGLIRRFNRTQVTIAGYSLGAHAAGFAGYLLGGELGEIIGLDAAGPLFTIPAEVGNVYRLDKTDAEFVQVLHTSMGTLGTHVKSGHADFYPNGGVSPQSNCVLTSHARHQKKRE